MESWETSSEIDLQLSDFNETTTVYDTAENNPRPPVTNFNQHFVNLTQLPKNYKLVGNINTKILVKSEDSSTEEKETSGTSKPTSAVEQPPYNLRGISSFKRFIMSKTLPSGNTERLFKTKSRSKENIDLSRSLSRPNILKHKREESFDEMDISLSNSPIKVLAFSPSKFLNSEKDDTKFQILANTSEIIKDILYTNIPFNPEDSGIENSDIEVSGSLSPPSLTSTPMSTRSRRKTALRSISFLSPESKQSIPLQSTPKGNNSPDNNIIKTPVIRKFLNESAPRTPTPFKCPNDTCEDHDEGINSTMDEPFLSPERDFCFKRPSPISFPIRRHKHTNKKRSEKTARKALILEQDNIKRNLFNNKDEEISSLATKFSPSSELLHATDFEQSSLIGHQTFVEKRTVSSKSVYRTRRKTIPEKKSSLNKHWVSVACGGSHDQRVMTEAAKRCLRHRPRPVRYSL